jgi:hypothetical protein
MNKLHIFMYETIYPIITKIAELAKFAKLARIAPNFQAVQVPKFHQTYT